MPCLIGLHEGAAKDALAIGLAYAKGIGVTRAGVIETTFAEETETDLFVEQVVEVQLLAAVAAETEQVWVGTLVVTTGEHVTVVQLLPADGPAAVQVATGTFVVVLSVQVVDVHRLPAAAAVLVQLAGSTAVGPVDG